MCHIGHTAMWTNSAKSGKGDSNTVFSIFPVYNPLISKANQCGLPLANAQYRVETNWLGEAAT